MQQSVIVTGLGNEEFESGIRGALCVYQCMQSTVTSLQGRMREWVPTRYSNDLALKIGNRYLTRSREQGEDQLVDLSGVIDPFNVLRPVLRNVVHTTDNVVEYWERTVQDSK